MCQRRAKGGWICWYHFMIGSTTTSCENWLSRKHFYLLWPADLCNLPVTALLSGFQSSLLRGGG